MAGSRLFFQGKGEIALKKMIKSGPFDLRKFSRHVGSEGRDRATPILAKT